MKPVCCCLNLGVFFSSLNIRQTWAELCGFSSTQQRTQGKEQGAFTPETLFSGFWMEVLKMYVLITTVFHLMCLCTSSTPVNTEHANRNLPTMYTNQARNYKRSHSGPGCADVLCSPAAFEQTQRMVKATYQTDHTRLSAGQSKPWPWLPCSWEKSGWFYMQEISTSREGWRSLATLHISDHTTHLKDKRI